MSVTNFSSSNYLSATLSNPATHTKGVLVTYWAKIATADAPSNYSNAAQLATSGGAETLDCDCALDQVSSLNSGQERGPGTPIPRDVWALCGHYQRETVGSGYNSLYAYWTDDGTLNANTNTPDFAGGNTEDWNTLLVGNAPALNQPFVGKLANMAVWSIADNTAAEAILTALWNSGSHKRSDNIPLTASPVWQAYFESDISSGSGGALVETGTITVDAENPTLEAPTPVNPVFTAGPSVGAVSSDTIQSIQTPSEDCTIKVVAVAGPGGAEPDAATYNSTAFQQTVTAGTNTTIDVTGLTGLTDYTIWVKLDPAVGTATSSSFEATTTPAQPVLTAVNGGASLQVGATIAVTGSGFTGYETFPPTIAGVQVQDWTVTNDTTASFTAALGAVAFESTGEFNLGGATATVDFTPATDWAYTIIGTPNATKSARIDKDAAWDIAAGWQAYYDTKSGTIAVQTDGTIATTSTQAFTAQVYDLTDWSNTYTVTQDSGVPDSLAPELAATTSKTAIIDQSFSAQLNISGGDPATSWAIVGGADQASYSITNAGVLSRTAPNPTIEDEIVQVTAINGVGTSGIQTVTVSYIEALVNIDRGVVIDAIKETIRDSIREVQNG